MDEKPAQPQLLAGTQAILPPERAFVVQLRVPTEASGEIFVGRAEHIVSGAAERFDSAEALIAFIAKVMGPEGTAPVPAVARRPREAP